MNFWVQVSSPGGQSSALECDDALTPYNIETVGEYAALAGAGAHVDVAVPIDTSDALMELMRKRLARACRRGVDVTVRRLPAH